MANLSVQDSIHSVDPGAYQVDVVLKDAGSGSVLAQSTVSVTVPPVGGQPPVVDTPVVTVN